jgi:hypothetical protein
MLQLLGRDGRHGLQLAHDEAADMLTHSLGLSISPAHLLFSVGGALHRFHLPCQGLSWQ